MMDFGGEPLSACASTSPGSSASLATVRADAGRSEASAPKPSAPRTSARKTSTPKPRVSLRRSRPRTATEERGHGGVGGDQATG